MVTPSLLRSHALNVASIKSTSQTFIKECIRVMGLSKIQNDLSISCSLFKLYQLTRENWDDANGQNEKSDDKHAGDPSEQRGFSDVSKFCSPSFIG